MNGEISEPVNVEAETTEKKKPYKRPVTMTEKKKEAVKKMLDGLKQHRNSKETKSKLVKTSEDLTDKINTLSAKLEEINNKLCEKEKATELIINKPVAVEKKLTKKKKEKKIEYVNPDETTDEEDYEPIHHPQQIKPNSMNNKKDINNYTVPYPSIFKSNIGW